LIIIINLNNIKQFHYCAAVGSSAGAAVYSSETSVLTASGGL
jgi:hypothetical protein